MIGTQHLPLAVLLAYAVTCCLWTPMVPLTDAYALRGVARYGLNYGPLAAVGLGGLRGRRAGLRAAGRHRRGQHLIWVIVGGGARRRCQPRAAAARPAKATCGAVAWRQRLAARSRLSRHHRGRRPDPGQPRRLLHLCLHHLAGVGLGGLTIAGLWVLGVLAEIVVFALSPRFTLPPALLVVIGGLSAVVRWLITAQEPSVAVLAVVQLAHGLTFGLTQVGTMGLLVRHVPGPS